MSYVLGFKKFVSNIGYEGELAICSETNDDEELVSKCMEGCARCKISLDQIDTCGQRSCIR